MACIMVISLQLVALYLLLSSVFHRNSCLFLDGSTSSYAKFPKWPSCSNSSLSFEFATRRPNGLLLYVEFQKKLSFMKLKLVGGSLNLQFNHGSGVKVLLVGENLHDGRRHVVTLHVDSLLVLLSVDSMIQAQHVMDFADHSLIGGYLYVGGLPNDFIVQIDALVLIFVLFETRFQGSVTAMVYSQCSAKPTSVRMLEASGLRSISDEICEEQNPCQNNGECVSTETGVVCDCSDTEYSGTHCEAGQWKCYGLWCLPLRVLETARIHEFV